MSRPQLLAVVSVLALVGASACGDGTDDAGATTASEAVGVETTVAETESTEPATSTPGSAANSDLGESLSGDLTVFAAASLTDAFGEVAAAFESAHPDVDVELAFDGSSALVAQIVEGAPADVFASADEANMTKLTEADLAADDPTVFATNELAVIVAPDNPLGIDGLADLAGDDVTVVLCAIEVPCGAYAEEILTTAGVTVEPASYEQNVRGVASKVVEGEADAGIVYVTDVVAAGDDAALVPIAAEDNLVATYPAAPVAESANPEAAAAFVEFLVGDDAQEILAEFGFGSP